MKIIRPQFLIAIGCYLWIFKDAVKAISRIRHLESFAARAAAVEESLTGLCVVSAACVPVLVSGWGFDVLKKEI